MKEREKSTPGACFEFAGAVPASSPSSSSSATTLLSIALSLSDMLPRRPLALQCVRVSGVPSLRNPQSKSKHSAFVQKHIGMLCIEGMMRAVMTAS